MLKISFELDPKKQGAFSEYEAKNIQFVKDLISDMLNENRYYWANLKIEEENNAKRSDSM